MVDHGSKLVARGRLNIKMSYHYREPMLKIRWSHNRLIFYMGIRIPGKDCFILRRGPDPDQHFSDHCDPIETLPSEYSGNNPGCPSEN